MKSDSMDVKCRTARMLRTANAIQRDGRSAAGRRELIETLGEREREGRDVSDRPV